MNQSVGRQTLSSNGSLPLILGQKIKKLALGLWCGRTFGAWFPVKLPLSVPLCRLVVATS